MCQGRQLCQDQLNYHNVFSRKAVRNGRHSETEVHGRCQTYDTLGTKKFSKCTYKDKALHDLTTSFPGQNHLKRLDEAAQCIANALKREVKAQLRQNREPTSTQTVSSLLSDTVIQDLYETLTVDVNKTTDIQRHHRADDLNVVDVDHGDKNVEEKDDDSQAVVNDSDDSVLETLTAGTEDNESTQQLDNSITVLKQITVAADKSKTNNGNSKNTFKCCDSCKVKP